MIIKVMATSIKTIKMDQRRNRDLDIVGQSLVE